jgi:hypothetical protein
LYRLRRSIRSNLRNYGDVATPGVSWARGIKMTKADRFRQYADEAMRWAFQSKTEKEKQAYIDLAHTWTQAAVHSEHIFGVNDSPPEVKLGL